MQKYRVNNLDCAVCAQKLEDALNNTQGVRDASIDFGTLTLHLDADDTDAARRVVNELEPGVELEPLSRTGRREDAGAGETFRLKSEIVKIAAAAVLFVLVLVCDYYEGLGVPPALFAVLLAAAYLAAGGRVLAAAGRTVAKRDFFDENVLMAIATIGAIAIGAFSEAVGVMLFYRAGEFLQNLAVSRSRRSIASLLEQRPEFANLRTSAGVSRVAPESVSVGDVIVVKPGEKIPLDGSILEGDSQVDTSVLTGESVPRRVEAGDAVMAGGINMYGTILVEVTKPFEESSIAKMVELVENAAARKSTTENFITVFARYYTPAVVLAAMAVAFVPPLFITGASLEQWVYRALVLLVISCPCALVISIPLGYFGGIGRASRHGILVKGSNFIDALAGLKTVIFDKTGTLTEGVFEVEQVVHQDGYTPEQVLEFAAMAEQHSNHPIARAIVAAYENKGHRVAPERVNGHVETSGSGVRVEFDGTAVIVGNDRYMHSHGIPHDQCMIEGTVAHVAVGGNYAGYILIGDRIREDAGPAIASLRANGIDRILMLTGDNQCAADYIADRLELDGHFADLLPEDKVAALERIHAENAGRGRIAFVGDGINDAPVIARADVGVAMGGLGSDVAIETADVVLMTDSPARMAEAVTIARQTRVIVWQNIFIALSVKGAVIALGIAGLATMWAAVFADVGTALIAVVNSTRILGKKIR